MPTGVANNSVIPRPPSQSSSSSIGTGRGQMQRPQRPPHRRHRKPGGLGTLSPSLRLDDAFGPRLLSPGGGAIEGRRGTSGTQGLRQLADQHSGRMLHTFYLGRVRSRLSTAASEEHHASNPPRISKHGHPTGGFEEFPHCQFASPLSVSLYIIIYPLSFHIMTPIFFSFHLTSVISFSFGFGSHPGVFYFSIIFIISRVGSCRIMC